jgi:hypothetical protein
MSCQGFEPTITDSLFVHKLWPLQYTASDREFQIDVWTGVNFMIAICNCDFQKKWRFLLKTNDMIIHSELTALIKSGLIWSKSTNFYTFFFCGENNKYYKKITSVPGLRWLGYFFRSHFKVEDDTWTRKVSWRAAARTRTRFRASVDGDDPHGFQVPALNQGDQVGRIFAVCDCLLLLLFTIFTILLFLLF